jgi:hypothetical protein
MNRKRLIIIGIILLVIIIGVAIYFLTHKQSGFIGQPTKSLVQQGQTVVPSKSTADNFIRSKSSSDLLPQPPVQEFYNTIVASGGVAPDVNGQVQFGITKIQQPLHGWFVVTITMPDVEPNEVILQATGSSDSLTVIAGPGTAFPADSVSLPDAVRAAL